MGPIVFILWIIISLVSVIGHWVRLTPPGGHPLGNEWVIDQMRVFTDHAGAVQVHLISSMVFAFIAPFQFFGRFRGRFISAHRLMGRVFFINLILVVLSGQYLGLVIPFDGWPEVLYTVMLLIAIPFSAYMGISFVKKRDILNHRIWMIRLLCLSMSIATMRIFLATLTSIQPWDIRTWFGVSLILALLCNVLLGELYIKFATKRPSPKKA